MPDTIKDFGTLNGYDKIPEEVDACWLQNHPREGREIGRCYIETYCPVCKIRYRIDSSD